METIGEVPDMTTLLWTGNISYNVSQQSLIDTTEPFSYLWVANGSGSFTTKLIMLPFRILIGVVIIVGSTTTAVAIVKLPRLHTKTNMILCSLSIADILVGVILFFLTIRTLVITDATCDNIYLLDTFALIELFPVGVSLFHLAAIAVDRYMAVVWPLHYDRLMTDRVVLILILSVWLVCLFLLSCYCLWYIGWDPQSCVSPVPAYFDYFMKCGTHLCLTPILVALYCRIYFIGQQQRIKIRALELPGLDTESRRMAKQKIREHKATMMTLVVSLVSVILWTPYFIFLTMHYLGKDSPVISTLFHVSVGLGVCNSGANFFIYAYMNSELRMAFAHILKYKMMFRNIRVSPSFLPPVDSGKCSDHNNRKTRH